MKLALDIPPGLFPDDTSFGSPGRWRDGSNVRFWRGRPQTIGGWERLTLDPLNGVVRNIFGWTDKQARLNLAFASHTSLQVLRGGMLYTITPAGLAAGRVNGAGGLGYGTGAYGVGGYGLPSTGVYYARTWSLSAYGETLIANPRGGPIYRTAAGVTAPATAIPNAPPEVTYALVAPGDIRQVLAFGCNEEVGGGFNPLCIRFSDVENITDWTTKPTNAAGEVILDGGARIVGARNVGSNVFVWTDSALYLGTFTADPNQPLRFDRVGEHCGLIGPNAAAVVGLRAFWLAPDGAFHSCAVGQGPERLDSPVAQELFDNLAPSQADKVHCHSVASFGEVWWHYPDERDGLENSRYVALGLADGAWFRGKLARTAFIDAGPMVSPVAVSADAVAYYHERGQSADGAALPYYLESADQYLSEGEALMMVRGVWPDVQGQQGGIALSILARMQPQGPERAYGPYMLTPNQARADFRLSGRLARLRYEGASSPAFMRLGRPVYDVTPLGAR